MFWTTVARGPLPKAGSVPSRCRSHPPDGHADREPPDDERLGLRAHSIGHVDNAGNEEGQRHGGLELALEGVDHSGRCQRPDQADEEPRQPVGQPAAHGLLAGPAGGRRVGEEATDAGQVLVVLGEQHGEQPAGRDEPHEATRVVDDGQAGLTVVDGLPRRLLLVGVRTDDRRVGVHEIANPFVAGRAERRLDGEQAHQAVVVADGDVGDALVAVTDEPGAQLGDRGGGPDPGDGPADVAAADAAAVWSSAAGTAGSGVGAWPADGRMRRSSPRSRHPRQRRGARPAQGRRSPRSRPDGPARLRPRRVPIGSMSCPPAPPRSWRPVPCGAPTTPATSRSRRSRASTSPGRWGHASPVGSRLYPAEALGYR